MPERLGVAEELPVAALAPRALAVVAARRRCELEPRLDGVVGDRQTVEVGRAQARQADAGVSRSADLSGAFQEVVGHASPPPHDVLLPIEPAALEPSTQELVRARRAAQRRGQAALVRADGDVHKGARAQPRQLHARVLLALMRASAVGCQATLDELARQGRSASSSPAGSGAALVGSRDEPRGILEGDPLSREEGGHVEGLVQLSIEGMAMHRLDPLVRAASDEEVEGPRLTPDICGQAASHFPTSRRSHRLEHASDDAAFAAGVAAAEAEVLSDQLRHQGRAAAALAPDPYGVDAARVAARLDAASFPVSASLALEALSVPGNVRLACRGDVLVQHLSKPCHERRADDQRL
eukprot:761372-Hanusia_phi.AAC.1